MPIFRTGTVFLAPSFGVSKNILPLMQIFIDIWKFWGYDQHSHRVTWTLNALGYISNNRII
jgi:hypothetical protein